MALLELSTVALPVAIGTWSPPSNDASPLSTTTSEGLERILTSVIAESALMTTRGDAGWPAMILRPPNKPGPVVVVEEVEEPLFEATLLMRLGICPAAVLEIAPPWRKNCTP